MKLNPREQQQNNSYDGKFSFSAFSTGKENKHKKWLLGGLFYHYYYYYYYYYKFFKTAPRFSVGEGVGIPALTIVLELAGQTSPFVTRVWVLPVTNKRLG